MSDCKTKLSNIYESPCIEWDVWKQERYHSIHERMKDNPYYQKHIQKRQENINLIEENSVQTIVLQDKKNLSTYTFLHKPQSSK